MRVCELALERGVFAQAIRPPTVPDGSSRLRLAVMASHGKGELRDAARTLAQAVAAPVCAPRISQPPVTAPPAAEPLEAEPEPAAHWDEQRPPVRARASRPSDDDAPPPPRNRPFDGEASGDLERAACRSAPLRGR